MLYERIIDAVKSQRSRSSVFNPYTNTCEQNDKRDSPEIRLDNLMKYVAAYERGNPRHMWIAESGSYAGLRRTGIPLIPETSLEEASNSLGLKNPFEKATTTEDMTSYSAKVIWDAAKMVEPLPFLWNAVMMHTYNNSSGKVFSNRKPNSDELNSNVNLINLLMEFFNFESIICIGRSSETLLKRIGVSGTYVRHPSQGGVNMFRASIHNIYGINF